MKISVIIVNFNGKDYLKECVDSVLVSDFDSFEVVVVDNGSIDGSGKGLSGKVKLIRSEENLFFTGGSNLGARKAKGDWLVFLNSDTVVDKDWLKELWKVAKTDKKLTLQPKIKIYGTDKIDCVIGRYYFGFGVAAGRGKRDKYQGLVWGDYANGTCLMINRKWFFDLGGFDESFKFFYEDVDLQLRARKRGGRAVGVMSSVIEHKGSLSFKQNVASKIVKQYYRRNRWRTWLKQHSGWINWIRLIELKKVMGKQQFSWLDLGCGEGELMALGRKLGIEVVGYDQRLGQKIERLKISRKFDVVSLYHVLEHIQEPERVLNKVRGWLKTQGVLVVEIPLIGNFTERFLKDKYLIYFDKTHVNFWTKEELLQLLEKTGWQVIKKKTCWYEYPLTVMTQGGVIGFWLWLPLKLLSIFGFNDEIIRYYCVKL